MNPSFTLVIPTLTGHRRICILLNTALTSHPFPIFIVDNATEKRCVSASWNLGIRTAFEIHHSKYAVLANDDILFHPDCLDAMVATAEQGHHFVNCALLKNNLDLASKFTQGGFSLFLIDTHAFEKVGEFDERFTPAYYEDNDYYYRMKLAGIAEQLAPGAGFYHHIFKVSDSGPKSLGWTTTAENQELREAHGETMRRNLAYYESKWGGPPGKEQWTKAFNSP